MLHFDRNSRRMTFAREPFKFQKSKFGFFFCTWERKVRRASVTPSVSLSGACKSNMSATDFSTMLLLPRNDKKRTSRTLVECPTLYSKSTYKLFDPSDRVKVHVKNSSPDILASKSYSALELEDLACSTNHIGFNLESRKNYSTISVGITSYHLLEIYVEDLGGEGCPTTHMQRRRSRI